MDKKIKWFAIIFGIGVFIFALFISSMTPGLNSAESIPFTTIKKGFYSNYREPAQALIFKESDLLEFGIENSGIDFSSAVALFISMGERNSGGYSIEVSSILRSGDNLFVQMTEKSPGINCFTIAVLTQPHHLVVFDSSVKFSDIVFTTHSVVVNC